MLCLVRQKLLSFGDKHTIKDSDGNDAFFVDGEAFTIGAKLSFQDMGGNELLYIRQQLLRLKPTFLIERDGEAFATITRDFFALLRSNFDVDVPGPNDYRVEGDFLSHEFEFTRPECGVVATVSKRFLTLRDIYSVDIVADQDDALILAVAVVVDQACHTRGG